jgi:hypothetical protein
MYPIKENIVTLVPESILGVEEFLANAVQQEFENTSLIEEVDTFWLRMRVPVNTEISDDILTAWRSKLSVTLQKIPVAFKVGSLIVDDELSSDPSMLQIRGLIVFSGLDPYTME